MQDADYVGEPRRFPEKHYVHYDFSFQPSLDRDRIMALAQLEFIERRQAVHFLGPPGHET